MAYRLPYYQADHFATSNKIQQVKNAYTPPVPFVNDKNYGNKLSMYGTLNKIRGTRD